MKIKIFIDSDATNIENDFNKFLEENLDIEIVNIFATESIVNDKARTTIYILYKVVKS